MARHLFRSERTRRTQRKVRTWIGLGIALAAIGLWAIGFASFQETNSAALSLTPDQDISVGIVVLTGSSGRLQSGMDALTAGQGERLLISGVNEIASSEAVQALVHDPRGLFPCCVDLDYEARTTSSNAREAMAWAQNNEFEGLVVVTSYYHMPRALLELRHQGPEIALYPLRVEPENYDADDWWHPGTLRILALEYTKYELELLRIRLDNLF